MANSQRQMGLPDVLGMITGGARLNISVIQCALAVHPTSIAVGQTLEALLLLQNACDKPVQVQVTIQLPRKDAAGNRLTLISVKEPPVVSMQPGETGLLHIPIVAFPPTAESQNTPLGIKLDVRAPKGYAIVRPPQGGRPASMLSMSPFRLNILKEVGFTIKQEGELLIQAFNIMPGVINAPQPEMVSRYEVLWTTRELQREQAHYVEMRERAATFAGTLKSEPALQTLLRATEKRFAAAGLPLHPAEALFVAKSLTYTLFDGLREIEGFGVENASWFQRLTTIMDDKTTLGDLELLIAYIYTALLTDAVALGLFILEKRTGENLGTRDEHRTYALEVVEALNQQTLDLSHAYLPLVLAGITLNARIKDSRESLWASLNYLGEAWRGRTKLADSSYDWVAQILDVLLDEAEKELIALKVPKN